MSTYEIDMGDPTLKLGPTGALGHRAPSGDWADIMSEFYRPSLAETPEKNLIFAVLIHAVVLEPRPSDREWVRRGDSGGFTFNGCCEALDMDPAATRRKILRHVVFDHIDKRAATERKRYHENRKRARLRSFNGPRMKVG